MKKPRPRKIITRVIVFVLAGALINVAVAWALALSVDITARPVGVKNVKWSGADWMTWTLTSFGSARLVCNRSYGLAQRFVELEALGPLWEAFHTRMFVTGDTQHWWMDLRGWPRLSMWSEKVVLPPAVLRGPPIEEVRYGMAPQLPKFRNGYERVLPLHPIWPGFAINTVFYAAVLAALFLGPGMVRRALRQRRGLCPACAYPVGVNDKCTECGSPLPLKVEDSPRRGEGTVRVDTT